MRIVIDKDISEIQLLQEAYEKGKPSYKVLAVENGETFVYGTKLRNIKEAVNAIYDIAWDENFNDCQSEIVEVFGESEHVIWSSDPKVQVCESVLVSEAEDGEKKGLWDKIKGGAKKALDGLKKGLNIVGAMTKQFSKDMLNKWRNAGYFTKQGEITGLGYKVMTGQAKNTVPVETDDKTSDIAQVWKIAQSNVVNALKAQGFKVNGEIKAIVEKDKDPITMSANVVDKDGNESTFQLDQQGNTVGGKGINADNPAPGSPAAKAKAEQNGGNNVNTQQITPDQAQKNPKAALGNLATRVANLEKEVGIAAESWNFNNEVQTNKAGLERLTIRRFFNEMNDPSVKEIVFVSESGEKKTYYTNSGSAAYVAFKKDLRESTDKCAKIADLVGYKVTFESSMAKSNRRGFKFSDFGMDDDFDSASRTLVIKESVTRVSRGGDDNRETSTKKEVVKESIEESSDARFSTTTVDAKTSKADPEPSGFELEVGDLDPKKEVEDLLNSMNRYNGQEKDKPKDGDGTIDTGVSTYPDVPEPKKQEMNGADSGEEIVKEAEGDEGGDDAGGEDDAGGGDDPFAGGDDDAGGGDDAGGDADPFAGGEDDAGGGDDADPFAGGEDEGEAGAEGDEGAGAEGGADAGTKGSDATDEPAPESPVNTDAQGNPKSQYNINVTTPFNVNDNFALNEEEQKEFFGKIDQLVKIPDMDNYSLYLYQITPENMNLDDVHYIQALYDLSVKLGLLEDVYADSNLLEKYNSYKYSVMKKGEDNEGGEFKIQEQKTNPIWGNKVVLEAKDKDSTKKVLGMPTVQTDNEDKNKESKKIGASEKDDDRRGPKDMKLDLDENGAMKPKIIDTTKEGWDSLNGKDHDKLVNSTVEGAFHGLGWIVTFKAMQFGSPRFMSMYIKRKGDEKAEKQCEEYLKKLSYTEIEILNLEEIDPYEYLYRTGCSGMKMPEEIATAKIANKDIPYLESSNQSSLPNDIKRDVKRVITKLNAEIRGTKQFNFMAECGIEKPQIVAEEFLAGYKTAQVNETLSETTYKFVFRKDDSIFSRMFYSNMKEKLFKYLGSFAQKFNMECGCEVTPTCICIDFMRSDIGNPGYDLDTMIDADIATQPVEEPIEQSNIAKNI